MMSAHATLKICQQLQMPTREQIWTRNMKKSLKAWPGTSRHKNWKNAMKDNQTTICISHCSRCLQWKSMAFPLFHGSTWRSCREENQGSSWEAHLINQVHNKRSERLDYKLHLTSLQRWIWSSQKSTLSAL